MKYIGMPLGMWLLFEKSFREQLVLSSGMIKIPHALYQKKQS